MGVTKLFDEPILPYFSIKKLSDEPLPYFGVTKLSDKLTVSYFLVLLSDEQILSYFSVGFFVFCLLLRLLGLSHSCISFVTEVIYVFLILVFRKCC